MKVLVLTGPESSGKSWLGGEIQSAFGGVLVGEYVRHFIDTEQRETCYADVTTIARGQLAWEDAARAAQPTGRDVRGTARSRRRQIGGLLQLPSAH